MRNNSRRTVCGFSLNFTSNTDAVGDGSFGHLGVHFGASVGLSGVAGAHFSVSCDHVMHSLHSSKVRRSLATNPVISPKFLTLVGSPFLRPCHCGGSNALANTLRKTSSFTGFGADAVGGDCTGPLSVFRCKTKGGGGGRRCAMFSMAVTPRVGVNGN